MHTAGLEGRYKSGFSSTGQDAPESRRLCFEGSAYSDVNGNNAGAALPTTDLPLVSTGTKFVQFDNKGVEVGSGTISQDSTQENCYVIAPTATSDGNNTAGVVALKRRIVGAVCPNFAASCSVVCHNGDEDHENFKDNPTISFSKSDFTSELDVVPEVAMAGDELFARVPQHGCSNSGAKIYATTTTAATTYATMADTMGGGGGGAQAICDPQRGKVCTMEELNYIVVGPFSQGGQTKYMKLAGAVHAPYEAAGILEKKEGVVGKYDTVTIQGIDDANGTKPVITTALSNAPVSFQLPAQSTYRSPEGVVENDVNTNYMGSYRLRLLKIYSSKADVLVRNVSFKNGGICDDVQFNTHFAELAENDGTTSAAQASTIGVMLSEASTVGRTVEKDASKFCPLERPFVENDISGLGKRNGGAIYFSGKKFRCTNCAFENNRVTGNGGAVFVEPSQPGRPIADPDMDTFASEDEYPNRIEHEKSNPLSSTFECTNCAFRSNNAIGIARGAGASFGTFVGGFGGAIGAGLGVRYKRDLNVQNPLAKLVDIRRAYGSHGKLFITLKNCEFNDNHAWNSGGAMFVLGGKTVAKKSSFDIDVSESRFEANRAVQGEGGAIKIDKGSTNGDYNCVEQGCDAHHVAVSLLNTKFGTNKAGKSNEDDDVVGNVEVDDQASAWRHIDNFKNDQQCNADCCSESGSACALKDGGQAKCNSYENDWGTSYVCNDGIFMEGTETTNLCTITAKSNTRCPAGYHYGRMPGRCIPCESGRYQDITTLDTDPGSETCKVCPAGQYSTGTSLDGARKSLACTKCEAGKYQDVPEQPICKECSAVISNSFGSVLGGTSSRSCECMAGFYDVRPNRSDDSVLERDGVDTTRCVACPEGANCIDSGQHLRGLLSGPGYYRASEVSIILHLCSDVSSPGADVSKSTVCTGGNLTHQCAAGRNISVPLCDECQNNYIANAETNICESCEGQTGGVDLNAVMYACIVLGIIFGYIGSFVYLTKAAMMFDMLDDDDSGYIELEEFKDAVRQYKQVPESKLPDERLKIIFSAFCAKGTEGIPKTVFSGLWLHTLREAKDPKEKKYMGKRAIHTLVKANKHESNPDTVQKREIHIRALSDENQIDVIGSLINGGGGGGGGGRHVASAEMEVDEDADYALPGAGGGNNSSENAPEAPSQTPSMGATASMGTSVGHSASIVMPHLPAFPKMGSTVKIIFSWGQILSSFNLTFTIPWPEGFNTMMTALYAPFNIDIFFLFGNFKCQVNTNYSAQFEAHMMVPIIILSVIAAAYITARVVKVVLCCGTFMYDNKTLKARVMKLINLVVFVMYPGLGLRIFRVFATEKYGDHEFLRADLTVRTDTKEYQDMYATAWVWMVVYVLFIPMAYFVILHLNKDNILMDPDNEEQTIPVEFHTRVIATRTSYGAIYKDFKRKFYYFELVEMSRKIVLVGVLVLLGESAGTQIFVGVLICFFYVVACCLAKPLVSETDQFLQYVTSIQLFVTLIIGLLLRNRAFEREKGMGGKHDDAVIDFLLVFMTVVVFGTIFIVVFVILRDALCPNKKCCKNAKKSKLGSKSPSGKRKKKLAAVVPDNGTPTGSKK